MSGTITVDRTAAEALAPQRPWALVRHSLVLGRRSLIKSGRNPGFLMNGVMTPVIFLVLFYYLFGGAMTGSTGDYLQYLFPGILVMGTILSGMLSTGLNVNLDRKNGVADRFRSLPIGRSAPLIGSVLADTVRYVLAAAVLFGVGCLMGFRVETDFASALGAVGIAILFAFCLSWVTVLIGVLVKDEGAVLGFAFVAFLPLVLGTSLAAPKSTLPGWLEAWAGVNPVTHAMDATRGLLTGGAVADPVGKTLLWSAVVLVIFAPLAVLANRRAD
ncbi:ABC transporter permease [Embleya sp. NBC_00896]|uniref:ABC transporter permease n=1 Tax=Embleya sp. NBC_00896 TaxID=2975961 RepID=UPI00386F7F41|nr:ABC transporter permease [Embleya sp. NBC_00896]